jgi:DNA-binding SARP family transcriptional activator
MLGGFRVQVGGTWVESKVWRLQKARSLVKILALQPDHRMHREEITDLLWPDVGLGSSTNNFHRTLHAARRALNSADVNVEGRFLSLSRGVLDLYPDGAVVTDVEVFERQARSARQSSSVDAYELAIQLYTGHLLPEDIYEDWAADRRRSLRISLQSLLLGLAQFHEDRREYDQAIEGLTRVVELEPSDESAHIALIRQYAMAGRRQQALYQFHHLRELLRREFDDEPAAESQHLYREILSGRFPETAPERQELPRGIAAARSTKHQLEHPNNLPVALTSFVGRERELDEMVDLVSQHRLVTLTGFGGIGKTRLALEIGSTTLKAYSDGVWLVQLATATDSMMVEQAIAESFGIHERSSEPLLETIAEFLRSRTMLIILDNCEHLIQPTAEVVDHLLRYCPSMRVLATSREPLLVPGEVVWQLPPMAAPEPEDQCPKSVLACEAVQLFVERAQVVQSGFSVTESDVPHVSRICEQLNGMPLAIELAAARVSILSPSQLASRLDDTLPLLTDSPRTVHSRQHTMEAAIDWSYDRLAMAEQWLFRQLSVFVGGFSAEVVEAVVDADEVP